MKLDALCQNGMLSEMAFYSWVEISILCRRPPLWSFKRDRSKEKNKSKGTHRNLQHLDFFLLLSCLTRQLSCSSSSSPWVGHRSAEIEEASSDKGGMAMQEGKGGRLQAGRDKSEETYKTGEIKTLPHLNQLITLLASSFKFSVFEGPNDLIVKACVGLAFMRLLFPKLISLQVSTLDLYMVSRLWVFGASRRGTCLETSLDSGLGLGTSWGTVKTLGMKTA